MKKNSIRDAALAVFVVCVVCECAEATTYDQRPRPTIFLAQSRQFIAQDAWNGVALYAFNGGVPIRRFPASGSINRVETTADEKLLLIACDNGEIGIWTISTGDRLWWHTSARSGLEYIYDASFSWDGKSLIASNHRDFAIVFDAATGAQIGKVSFPPMQTNIMSVTLSPDGTKGAFMDLGERLFTFDTKTGQMKDTGLTGAWPVRYSANGRIIALRSNNSGSDEKLRIVATEDLSKKDMGQFGHIGHIKPTADGSFLVCATTGKGFNEFATVGMRYHSESGELKDVWKLPIPNAENQTDFDSEQMIGISTNFRLVTRLIDLRTGEARLTIDNSANYRPIILTYTSRDLHLGGSLDLWIVIVALTLAGGVAVYIARKRGRINPPSP